MVPDHYLLKQKETWIKISLRGLGEVAANDWWHVEMHFYMEILLKEMKRWKKWNVHRIAKLELLKIGHM